MGDPGILVPGPNILADTRRVLLANIRCCGDHPLRPLPPAHDGVPQVAAGHVPEGRMSGVPQAIYEDKQSQKRHQSSRIEAGMCSESKLLGLVPDSNDQEKCDRDELLLVRS